MVAVISVFEQPRGGAVPGSLDAPNNIAQTQGGRASRGTDYFTRDTLIPTAELGQRFTEWFPYRWDWLHCPAYGSDWATETRYPLSPAQLWHAHQSPETLVGVRFGPLTSYFNIDLDIGSSYAPEAIERALEPISGGAELIRTQSSHSGGLHLFCTFPQPVSTWDLACALRRCLEEAGIDPEAGQCEIFPNTKAYSSTGFSRYQGHRLPLQPNSGSYLLNRAGEPISDRVADLLGAFERCAAEVDWPALQEQLRTAAKWFKDRGTGQYSGSGKAEQWRADLEAAIDRGWTGPGQTDGILGKLAQYGRVFLGMEGADLSKYIEATAKSLDGFKQWCGDSLRRLAAHCRDWASSAMRRYRPYIFKAANKAPRENQNEARARDARERIAAAVAALEAAGEVPQTEGGLADALAKAARCSKKTLYKDQCLALWHPRHRLADPKVCNSPDGQGYSPSEPAEPAETPEALNPETIENRGHYTPLSMKRCRADVSPENEVFTPDRPPAALQAVGNPRTEAGDRTQIHRLRTQYAYAVIAGNAAQAGKARSQVQALGYCPDVVLDERWDGQLRQGVIHDC